MVRSQVAGGIVERGRREVEKNLTPQRIGDGQWEIGGMRIEDFGIWCRRWA